MDHILDQNGDMPPPPSSRQLAIIKKQIIINMLNILEQNLDEKIRSVENLDIQNRQNLEILNSQRDHIEEEIKEEQRYQAQQTAALYLD
jgi:hypothetical protein